MFYRINNTRIAHHQGFKAIKLAKASMVIMEEGCNVCGLILISIKQSFSNPLLLKAITVCDATHKTELKLT